MTRPRKLALIAALFAFVFAACVPITIPGLRSVHGQTWAARFEVEVRPGNVATIRLPVDLALKFTQSLNDVTAEATLQYDTGLFTLQTGGLVTMQGRLGLDDHLDLQSSSNALTFEGNFVGDRLVGTVAIAGVVPVGNVTFTRVR